jgi:hypothetical protein
MVLGSAESCKNAPAGIKALTVSREALVNPWQGLEATLSREES